MPPNWWQQAILAARSIIATGGRVLASSRSFWSQYWFPPMEQRREIVREAQALERASELIERGGVTGTLADLMSDAGIPSSDEGGGIGGGPQATVYFTGRYETGPDAFAFRSFSLSVPWGTSLETLEEMMQGIIDEKGEDYGLGEGAVDYRRFIIY